MSDINETIPSKISLDTINETIPSKIPLDTLDASLPQQKFQTKPWLTAAGVGCVVLLCVGFLISSSFFVGSWFVATSNASAPTTEVIAATTETELQEPEEVSQPDEEDEPGGAGVSSTSEDEDAGQPAAPMMGTITFALETSPEGIPVEPTFAFTTGVNQIHAVFDYNSLAPIHTWTQVWYYNGNELLSTSQPWAGAENGTFDYIVEAGGEPLPAGAWALEFYIDDELLTAGSFSIENVENEAEASQSITTTETIEVIKLYRLVYTKWNGQKHDLYIGDSYGGKEYFIMGRAAGPSWSPDGRYIFFYGEEGVDQQVINGTVYPMPGATNGIVRINAAPIPTSLKQLQMFQGHGWNDGTARSANVSPNGTMIAYDGDRGGGRRIYFLGTDANQQFRYEIIGEQADWGPDSQRIVYRSGRNNQTGLWISNRTDSGHIRITGGGTDSFPAWSPDGQTIAFSRDAGGNVDIYTVKVDGSDLKRLTDAPGQDTLPLYLPDGDLVFRSARGGRWGIWKMHGDGSDQTNIIPNAPVGPEWSFSKMDVLR